MPRRARVIKREVPPDPKFGNMLLEQFGGANGELAAGPLQDGTSEVVNQAGLFR